MEHASRHVETECGVNVAFTVVGSKWKPTILWRLSEGDRRFAQLRRSIAAISEKVLASQLRELERDGLITRSAHDGFPLRVDYALTERGADLNVALDAVAEWGHRNAAFIADARAETLTAPIAPAGRPQGARSSASWSSGGAAGACSGGADDVR